MATCSCHIMVATRSERRVRHLAVPAAPPSVVFRGVVTTKKMRTTTEAALHSARAFVTLPFSPRRSVSDLDPR